MNSTQILKIECLKIAQSLSYVSAISPKDRAAFTLAAAKAIYTWASKK